MNRITAIALLAIANIALAGTSFAQSSGVRANVPFDFTVGNQLLPAGTYTIKEQAEHVIVIRNHDKPIAAVSLVNGDFNRSRNGGILKFHRYGSQYFLSEILCDQEDMNLQIPTSKSEKKTAVQVGKVRAPGETLVAAR